ncbi:MAG: hypothetical protein AABX23_04510 [Nanoarchaeota archaeon]
MGNREYQVWDKKGEGEESWMQFRRFAVSYRKAFQTCIKKEVEDASNGLIFDDEDIFPSLLLFNHYVELSLKALLEKSGSNFKSHILKDLLEEVEKNYPDFKLSNLPRKLITDIDLINPARPLLDHEGFRYPLDNKRNKIWVTERNNHAFIVLGGVHTSSINLINEIEAYFKDKIIKA